MNLDVRLPIGLMFSIFGALLAVHGALGDSRAWEQHPLRLNINLYWGLVLLAFGMAMLALVVRGRRRPPG